MRILIALLSIACNPTAEFVEPIPDDGTFPREPVRGEELDRYEASAAWSEAHGGLALVVIRGGDVIYERFADGYDPSTPVHLFSGTKSFACPVALALQADGVLDLDEPVAQTLPDIQSDSVQIRHLLDFSSGLRDAFWRLSVDGMRERQRVEDKVAFAVGRPIDHAPGERFVYGSVHLWAFSGVLHDKLGQPALATYRERLLDPIGLRTAGWLHDPAGHTALPYGAWTTALEWARFGVLLRDDGMWQGERVLPAGIAAECFAPSAATPAYGLTFWRNAPAGPNADVQRIRTLRSEGPILGDAPADTVAAAGHNDQRLYIIPSRDLVIVRLSEGDRAFTDADFLEQVLR